MNKAELLDRLSLLHDLMSKAREVHVRMCDRADANYLYHVNAVNQLWDMIQKREGKYKTDATAQSWTRIMHEHYLQAKAIWDVFQDSPPPGMSYSPPPPSYVGKAS